MNVSDNSTQKCEFLRMCYNGIHVHSDTTAASPGSIQPCCNYCANTSLARVLRSTTLC